MFCILPMKSEQLQRCFVSSYQRFPQGTLLTSFLDLPNYFHRIQLYQKHNFSKSNKKTEIKGFRNWLESQFPNAIVSIPIDKSVSDAAKRKQNNETIRTTKKSNTTSEYPKQKYYYDHVLIDMNPLLHPIMKRARSDGHALGLLINELDKITSTIAIPTRSLVLAMDGPPSAAKLATQRRRRYSKVLKGQAKIKQYTKLLSTLQDTTTTTAAATATSLSGTNNNQKLQVLTKQMKRKKRRYMDYARTLCITPGTDFMKQVEQAIMYWAWQRLSSSRTTKVSSDANSTSMNNNNNKNTVGVQVYLSSSTVAGEGEIKLIEWIHSNIQPSIESYGRNSSSTHHHHQEQPSIALLGGDADLVLEGLVVPYTPNIFVLLPDGNKRYLAVSIWEITRTLDQYLSKPVVTSTSNKSKDNVEDGSADSSNSNTKTEIFSITPTIPKSTSLRDIMKIRSDLAVLLILNGNDYLPKLRGSAGFNRLFRTYIDQQRQWREEASSDTCGTILPDIQICLVNPVTLDYNLDFCIEYFRRLAVLVPTKLIPSPLTHIPPPGSNAMSLKLLLNMVEAGSLPSPLVFEVIENTTSPNNDDSAPNRLIHFDTTDDSDKEENIIINSNGENIESEDEDNDCEYDNDDDDDYVDDNEDRVLVRVQLGEPGMDNFYTREIWHPANAKLQRARENLAQIVLKELVYGNDDNDNEEDDIVAGMTNAGFDWEIKTRIEENVESYLYGILWNLQTYQDGVCADYGYNYGKRVAPSAHDIVKFLEKYKDSNPTKPCINIHDLASLVSLSRNNSNGDVDQQTSIPHDHFTPPVSAGISCLAALPSPVKHLVPEPYRYLSDETVKSIYASCMDPVDNYFYMKQFERLCEEQVVKSTPLPNNNKDKDKDVSKNDLDDGTHYWTVISKVSKPLSEPVTPPEPFSERFSKLRLNNSMIVSRIMASSEPRTRVEWLRNDVQLSSMQQLFPKDGKERNQDSNAFSSPWTTVDQIKYKTISSGAMMKKKDIPIVESVIIDSFTDPFSIDTDGLPQEVVTEGNFVGGPFTGIRARMKKFDKANVDTRARMKKFNLKPPPLQVPTTIDGATPLLILKQLSDAELIGEITWTSKHPSETEYASFDPNGHEQIILHISQFSKIDGALVGSERTYVQDRDVHMSSRQKLKHHLCTLALRDIIGETLQWNEVSYEEIRDTLVAKAAAN